MRSQYEHKQSANEISRDRSQQSDPFERLYSFAKKKQEGMVSREDEMYKRDSMRSPELKNPRKQRSVSMSMRETRVSRSRSAKANMTAQNFTGSNIKTENESSSQESGFLERLEESNKKRKEKINQLQDRFMKEQGITFKPKTLLRHIGSQTAKAKSNERSFENFGVYSNESVKETRSNRVNRSPDVRGFLDHSAVSEHKQTSFSNGDTKNVKPSTRKVY